jgi:hypothetical protein
MGIGGLGVAGEVAQVVQVFLAQAAAARDAAAGVAAAVLVGRVIPEAQFQQQAAADPSWLG